MMIILRRSNHNPSTFCWRGWLLWRAAPLLVHGFSTTTTTSMRYCSSSSSLSSSSDRPSHPSLMTTIRGYQHDNRGWSHKKVGARLSSLSFSSSPESNPSTTTTDLNSEDRSDHDDPLSPHATAQETSMTQDALFMARQAIQAVEPEAAIVRHVQWVKATKHDNNDNDDTKAENDKMLLQIGAATDKSQDNLQLYDLTQYTDIMIVAFGKASSGMATALVQVLLEQQSSSSSLPAISGTVIAKDDHATTEQEQFLAQHNIQVYPAAHPVPDQRGVTASRLILEQVQRAAEGQQSSNNNTPNKKTLLLTAISGGGSALFCTPDPALTLDDLQATNQVLLQSGMSIQEMNVIRKRLEVGKGGGLARATKSTTENNNKSTNDDENTTMVSLILSDVLGDPLDLIASGPTVPDTSTWSDAWKLVQQRLFVSSSSSSSTITSTRQCLLPPAVFKLLEEGYEKEKDNHETKEEEHQIQQQSQTCLVGNNALAVQRAAEAAQELGYEPIVLGTMFQGEARDAANFLVSMAEHIQQGSPEFSLASGTKKERGRIALIAGGETTVTFPTSTTAHGDDDNSSFGKGGRNQELALTAAVAMRQQRIASGLAPLRNIVVASVGTDGTDGPTDAAGAVVDGGTTARLSGDAMETLRRHDAYHYLDQQDEQGVSPLIRTGPTGTNVADVMMVLIDRS